MVPSLDGALADRTSVDLSSLQKYELMHAMGEFGLHWEDSIAMTAAGQAKVLGIQPGWKIYSIDGHLVRSDEEISTRLLDARLQWRSCCVAFLTDPEVVASLQNREKEESAKAVAERLARLPFEGAHDKQHLEQVAKQFQFQGWIEKVEDRAITLQQLQRVMQWAMVHCFRWRDAVFRVRLRESNLDMQLVCHWLVGPATSETGCSFVEMLTDQKQAPAWFVAHAGDWKLAELVRVLQGHSALRALPVEAGYWIGSFANRSQSMCESVTFDLEQSCTYRALRAADFHVLVALDPFDDPDGSRAANYSRLWCAFELSLCLDEPSAALDISAVQDDGNAVFLTRGLTDEEEAMEAKSCGLGLKTKSERENTFPFGQLEEYLDMQLPALQAGGTESRRKILNYFAGVDLDADVCEDLHACEKVLKRVAASMAVTTWRGIMVGGDDARMKNLKCRVGDAIGRDLWRESLDLCLAHASGSMEAIFLLTNSLPAGLSKLRVDLRNGGVTDEMLSDLSSGLPSGLEELTLNLENNAGVTNAGIANFTNMLPSKLRAQVLDLRLTSVSEEFLAACGSLEGLRAAIEAEAQRGNRCVSVNLAPSTHGHMRYSMVQSKVL